ncbi:MAG: hypothetical protein OXT09_11100 [Myxococcales bacterium]|nr:hypothetical protein [Myxococcales bacterium]
MYTSLLRDARFAHALFDMDERIAAEARQRPCARCGGPLHRADYRRKPRGAAWAEDPRHSVRQSLCCGRDGCRKRATPPSARFLGRRVYWAVTVVLGAALQHGLSARRVSRLSAELGVDRRTLSRWRQWWLQTYRRSEHFTRRRGELPATLDVATLPQSLLDAFTGDAPARMTALLRWLSSAPG